MCFELLKAATHTGELVGN